ncbi:MAG: NAD(P)-binding domain-containing protein, partial [Alphaproteobacteria bacterium]|nr:NAD(P)-binding domain-containing protein [Alphaproteobacteria bacterium]
MAIDIKKIGVIGSGQMGKGIAQVCATAGFDVQLMDANEEVLSKAVPAIEKSMGRLVAKEMMSEADKDAAVKRISTGTDMKGFKDCQLV